MSLNVSQSFRVREYYYMVLRHKKVFFMVLTLSLAVSMALCYMLPKMYRAETVLMVEDENILNPLISGLAISPSVAARMRTLKDELLSWQRLTLLAEKLGLDKNIRDPLQYEKLILNLRNHILILMKGTLVIIQYEGTVPKQAQQVVQALSDIVVDGGMMNSKVETNSAIQFIEEQLKVYRDKLEKSEARLREFEDVYNSTLPLATQMNEQILALRMELGRLLIENTEFHPRVVQTRQLIEQLERQRDDQMKKARDAGFDIAPEEYGELVSSVPRQRQQLEKLQRDYSVDDGIYTSLLKRLETARLSQTLENSEKGAKLRVLEPARLPLKPVKPNPVLIMVAGLIIGIALGATTIYFIEANNTSIRSLDEARDLLELPILGSISRIDPQELLFAEKMMEEFRVRV
jgi:uncharacterized protein involved in exopolysaccharide biosynthesis